tara:strand:+ start:565 stop:1134 length:570 start_codon:yes stop_codon:yes gene_type:complete
MANVFNQQLLNEDMCVICQENLSNGQTYTLPECKHTFHTNCIVTWFRHRPSSNDEFSPDGACPCCSNRGINYIAKTRRYWRRSQTKCEFSKSRLKLMREEEKKTTCPKELKRLFNRLRQEKENLVNLKKEYQDYKKQIKETNVNFLEAKNKMSNYRNSQWKIEGSIRSLMDTIIYFPIINIIIPTTIQI